MINKFKQSFYNPVCISCGSFFVREHLFCENCYQDKIQPKIDIKKQVLGNGINLNYLLDWVPFESDLLSEMVYRLKSDKCMAAWKHYSEITSEGVELITDTRDIKYIIPVPGSKKSSTHSYVFSQYLSQFLRKPVLNILEKKYQTADVKTEQKKKNKAERQNKVIQLCEQFTSGVQGLQLNEAHILIVDDIVTTGNSIMQSVEAFGGAKKISAVSIFYRT